MSINVTYPSEYPEVAVSGQNPRLAHLMNNDLSSPKSEMSAIHQYVYQSWIIKEEYPEISETLQRIAEVEMHHFQILGRLTHLLGGSPRCQYYQANQTSPWNGRMVNYAVRIRQILTADIASEDYAYHTYLNQSKRISDPKVAENLARLALDEKLHLAIFKKLLEDL